MAGTIQRTLLAAAFAAVMAISANAQSGPRVGEEAPEFTAATLDGDFIDLAHLRGKIVVITFWSTKCEICRSEIPRLNALANRFEGQQVRFLALTMENESRLVPFLKNFPFRFEVVPDSWGVLIKYADKRRTGEVEMAFPTYFIIGPDGSVLYRGSGWDRSAEITNQVDRSLSLASARKP